jgi:hypothetical protein
MNWWLKRVVLALRGKDAFDTTAKNIEEAFTCGGITYYQHREAAEMPYKRALAALTIFNEINNGIDDFFLEKWIGKVDAIISGQEFKAKQLGQLSALVEIIKERKKFILPADFYYKLASIRFFDATEDPNKYDFKYSLKKIEHWKQHEGAADFFTREPLKRLIPFLGLQGDNLQSYVQLAEQLDKIRLGLVLDDSSKEAKTISENYSARFYVKEMQQESLN